MRIFALCSLLYIWPCLCYAGEQGHFHIREGWDSFRFGLGIADTDNYSTQQTVVIHRRQGGADMIIDRYGKPTVTRSLDEERLQKLIGDVESMFSDATFEHKVDVNGPFPQISMILLVDTILHRDSYFIEVTSRKDSLHIFTSFVDDLAEQK